MPAWQMHTATDVHGIAEHQPRNEATVQSSPTLDSTSRHIMWLWGRMVHRYDEGSRGGETGQSRCMPDARYRRVVDLAFSAPAAGVVIAGTPPGLGGYSRCPRYRHVVDLAPAPLLN
jgi:hypothetical protein